jgi:hypothetical protein
MRWSSRVGDLPHHRVTPYTTTVDTTLRHRCTTAKSGMHLTLHRHDDELVAARAQWRAGDGLDDYRQWRPMVERSIAWLVARGNRRVRFRGVEKNQLGLFLRLAAINLRRMVNLGLDHNGEWLLRPM